MLATVLSEFQAYLEQQIERLDLPQNLHDALRYAQLGGGKRLRPCLMLLCCEAVGGNRRHALPPAAAIELIHTFSLIHDDLPAMDDDDMRRGRPTLHVHAGEAMAILTGDALMSIAFELIANMQLRAEHRIELVRELAHGTTRMIVGQIYDTLGGFPPKTVEQERLNLIHRNKTGALLRAACRMGAICGEADAARLEAITRYGESVGLMFQIVDDLLDVTQTSEHLGKMAGKDHSAGKLTFPGLIGVERSAALVEQLRATAHEAVQSLGDAANPLHEMCDYLAIRTK